MEWYQVLSLIIGVTGIGSLIASIAKSALDKQHNQLERGRQEELNDNIASKARDEIKPLIEEVKESNSKLSKDIQAVSDKVVALDGKVDLLNNGTKSTLRDAILDCYYKCADKGYRNDYDYENIHHLYESYHDLNGNSFVEDVLKRFDKLPVKEKVEQHKEVLNESNK